MIHNNSPIHGNKMTHNKHCLQWRSLTDVIVKPTYSPKSKSSYKTIEDNRFVHSLTCSSSQANNILLHFQAYSLHPNTQPNKNMSAKVVNFFSDNSLGGQPGK